MLAKQAICPRLMEDRRYEPTTHPLSRGIVKPDLITCRWRSVTVSVGGPPLPGSRMLWSTSKETKTDAVFITLYIVYYTNMLLRYVEWRFEIRISIYTNDISFIVYRFTSLITATFGFCLTVLFFHSHFRLGSVPKKESLVAEAGWKRQIVEVQCDKNAVY